ncbi:hypothetical protein A2U01_0095208, partial [Trifolium medium]|nr:hypothetical protein [Trifolium medium]
DKVETNGGGLRRTEEVLRNSNRREQDVGRGIERAKINENNGGTI